MTDKIDYISFIKENRTIEQARDIYDLRISDSRIVFDRFSKDFYERTCPVCGSEEQINLAKFDDRYDISQCKKCLTRYVNPAPNLEALDFYYNHCECNKKFEKLLKARSGLGGVILSERTCLVLDQIKSLLQNTSQKSIKVLDVGCSSGAFLNELGVAIDGLGLSSEIELYGIDIDENAINNPVSDNLNLSHTSVEEYVQKNKNSFDLILHFELLEHLHDPFLFISSLRDLLNDNGLMYFQTPNALGLDNQAIGYNEFRPLAHGIFPPMHLQAFTTQNITHFLLRANFEVKDISTPGNFDIDIIKNFLQNDSSTFNHLKSIRSKQSLAVFQNVIRELGASSHMAVLAKKVVSKQDNENIERLTQVDLGQNKLRTQEYFEKFNREKVLEYLIEIDDPVIFDVGSNDGVSILQFKKIWPKSTIHCFEPQHECWESLDRLANQHSEIIINKFAAGEITEKDKEFYTHDLNSGISGFNKINLKSKDSIDLNKIIDEDKQLKNYAETINHPRKVMVKNLDEYINENNIKRINLLKLDTQSFEIDILKGLAKSLSLIDIIISEVKFYDYYEKQLSFHELESLLNPFDFKLYDISHISKNPMNGRTDWVDVIYVKSS